MLSDSSEDVSLFSDEEFDDRGSASSSSNPSKAKNAQAKEEKLSEPSNQQKGQNSRRSNIKNLDWIRNELVRIRNGGRVSSKRYLRAGYRDVLNSIIQDVHRKPKPGFETLASSQMGASFWSTRDKSNFFDAVASYGVGDLESISAIVGTKAEAQVRAYCLLLQNGLKLAQLSKSSKLGVSHSEIPASFEISEECETFLNAAADALAASVDKNDVAAEKAQYGHEWLIDEDAADRIELRYEELTHDGALDDLTVDAMSNNENSPTPNILNPSKTDNVPVEDADSTSEGEVGLDHSQLQMPTNTPSPAEMLLRPAAFLQLSRNLFMNNELNNDLNWQHMNPISDAIESPAMFRSVLEDLHNLVVSLTRRLVQISIIQATSRIRAEDALHSTHVPAAVIRGIDVRTAVDVVGMNVVWRKYWAKVAGRCQVGVFSRKRKFDDGRPETRVGFRLSPEEVETALGYGKASDDGHIGTVAPEEIHDVEVWDAMNDEELDLFTEGESSDDVPSSAVKCDPDGDDNNDNDDDDDDDVQAKQETSPLSQPNRRTIKPRWDHRIEERYLEALDHDASLEEERCLRRVMNLPSPDRSQVKPEVDLDQLEQAGRVDSSWQDWREQVHYEAPWEQLEPPVPPEAFAETAARGSRARKRRKLLYDRIREQLEAEEVGNSSRGDRSVDDLDSSHHSSSEGDAAEET